MCQDAAVYTTSNLNSKGTGKQLMQLMSKAMNLSVQVKSLAISYDCFLIKWKYL